MKVCVDGCPRLRWRATGGFPVARGASYPPGLGKGPFMSRRTRIALAAAVAALSLVVVVAPASAGQNGPNNENAKKCQSYLDWVRADGSAFQSSGECTAYAAKGGQLVAKPPPLSAGCDALNDPKLDARYGNAGINNASFNAGEVVTVMTTSGPNAGATAAVLGVNDVIVDARRPSRPPSPTRSRPPPRSRSSGCVSRLATSTGWCRARPAAKKTEPQQLGKAAPKRGRFAFKGRMCRADGPGLRGPDPSASVDPATRTEAIPAPVGTSARRTPP